MMIFSKRRPNPELLRYQFPHVYRALTQERDETRYWREAAAVMQSTLSSGLRMLSGCLTRDKESKNDYLF